MAARERERSASNATRESMRVRNRKIKIGTKKNEIPRKENAA